MELTDRLSRLEEERAQELARKLVADSYEYRYIARAVLLAAHLLLIDSDHRRSAGSLGTLLAKTASPPIITPEETTVSTTTTATYCRKGASLITNKSSAEIHLRRAARRVAGYGTRGQQVPEALGAEATMLKTEVADKRAMLEEHLSTCEQCMLVKR